MGEQADASGRDHHRNSTTIHCAERTSSSGLYWQGWRAFRTDEPESGEPPALAFYCPACSEREFGSNKTTFRRTHPN
jgi:hypothetical protein